MIIKMKSLKDYINEAITTSATSQGQGQYTVNVSDDKGGDYTKDSAVFDDDKKARDYYKAISQKYKGKKVKVTLSQNV